MSNPLEPVVNPVVDSVVEFVVVEADGGSRGNPGPAGYGAVVLDPATGEVLAERSESIGVETNNVAEYRGLIAGLDAARELGARRVAVRMDSKLVVEQMKGAWQIKHASMRELARQAGVLRRGFDDVSFEWIPRELNKRADRLANEAMDRAAGKPTTAAKPAATRPAAPGARPGAAANLAAAPSWTPPVDTATRLILVRHGSTVHSARRRFSGRNDLPLDDPGRQQAAALAARPFGAVAAVAASPLRRAQETAAAIAAPLGLPLQTVDDLVETDFGEWEGKTMAEVAAADQAALDAWLASPDVAPPGGEPFTAVDVRVLRARDALLSAHAGQTVVVVTHVTPIKVLVRFALDAPPVALYRLHLDTASVSIVDYYVDGNCSVRLVNDTSHLPR
ncbi:bifunctional RNase H/acid phosphatase [uncultured Jatrophihabitans sp.]|uniref:bifunctional RNase H/acid phosphatase n=1 Tax=uncultured Jatrophihabitans sp. TaxID=1610747 RepID=UPI0035CC1A9C